MFESPESDPRLDLAGAAWLFAVPAEERLRVLRDEPPSVRTQWVLEITAAEPLSSEAQLLVAEVRQRHEAAAAAAAIQSRVDATAPRRGEACPELAESALALALRRTDGSVRNALAAERRLVADHPTLFTALSLGDTTMTHVRALLDATRNLSPAQCGTVDDAIGRRSATMTAPAFGRVARQAVAAADTTPAESHRRAKRAAGVSWWPEDNGMGLLGVRMTAADGTAMLAVLKRRACDLRQRKDPRTQGQRQVAALCEPFIGDTTTAPPPDAAPRPRGGEARAGVRTLITAHIDLLSLLGLRARPGELDGHGPIPADDVRDLLRRDGSVLHRLVYDPVSGNALDYSTAGYVPDAALRAILGARDVTCRYPGCTRLPMHCDVEHVTPHAQGGATSTGNCSLLCRRHHNRKTHDGYRYSRPDPETGETVWRLPGGRTYRQQPARYSPLGRDPGDTLPGERPKPCTPDDPDPPPF